MFDSADKKSNVIDLMARRKQLEERARMRTSPSEGFDASGIQIVGDPSEALAFLKIRKQISWATAEAIVRIMGEVPEVTKSK